MFFCFIFLITTTLFSQNYRIVPTDSLIIRGTDTSDTTIVVVIWKRLRVKEIYPVRDTLKLYGIVDLSNTTSVSGLSVTDEAYGAGWDSDTEPPTKNAVYDKIETLAGGHDAVTLAGQNYASLSGQEITFAQINLSSHVTSSLPLTGLNTNTLTSTAVATGDTVIYIDPNDSGNWKKGPITLTGGSGTPGGSDTQIQYNDGGSFGGDSGLLWTGQYFYIISDGDTAKINLYKQLYLLDLEVANSRVFAVDSSGNVTLAGTLDDRDIATDGSKLDGIEALADVTDATNVAAAGAVMDGDFSSNGLMTRTGAGTYSVTANLSALNTLLGSSVADGAHVTNYVTNNADDIMAGDLTLDDDDVGTALTVRADAAGTGATVGLLITTDDDDNSNYGPIEIRDDSGTNNDLLFAIDYTGTITTGSVSNINQITTRPITSLSATNYRIFVSQGGGVPTEIALGSSGTYLQSQGASSAPTWSVPAGSGDVSKDGTPADNQVTVWTGNGTAEGNAEFLWVADTSLVISHDVDTLKIQLYKSLYAFDLEIGNSRVAAIDTTGLIVSAVGIDAIGATDFDIGSADLTDVTIITDGGSVVLDGSVTSASSFIIGSADVNETELEIIDGATLNTTDLNIIDGISDSGTLTSTELLYVDGVTSAIQTQIDGKEGTLTNSAGLRAALSDESGTGVFLTANGDGSGLSGVQTGVEDDTPDDNTELPDMAAYTFKMRNAATTGDPQDVKIPGLTSFTPAIGDSILGWDITANIMGRFALSQLESPLESVLDIANLQDFATFFNGQNDANKASDSDSLGGEPPSYYEVQLNNEAGLYAVLSDVINFLQTGDALAGGDITDGSIRSVEVDSVGLDGIVTNNTLPSITATFTNKTFDADGTGNSITNIENADIKAAAGIVYSKLAFSNDIDADDITTSAIAESEMNWGKQSADSVLTAVKTAASNDFHNIGGTDDDVPESGDFGNGADLESDGSISNDAVALTTQTTGNYVASITNGSGISGGDGGSEGAALTLAATLGTTIDSTEIIESSIHESEMNWAKQNADSTTSRVNSASATVAGKVELATTAETTTGTDATRAVTPDGLEDGFDGSTNITTLGTIGTGTWNATTIDEGKLDLTLTSTALNASGVTTTLGTVSGAVDVGGATSLEIPNGANPTTDASGEVAYDSDDEALEIFNNTRSASMLISPLQERTFTILFPDTVQSAALTHVPVFRADAIKYPGGATVVQVAIQLESDAAYQLIFEEWTGDPIAQTSQIDTVATGASDTYAESTPITDKVIAADNTLMVELPTTNVDAVTIVVYWYINDNN